MAENINTKNKAPAMSITVDDGFVKVPIINNEGEEIGVFNFRPSDIGIIDRYNEVSKDFDKIIAPLEHIDIGADGEANKNDSAAAEALKTAKERLYKACNHLFGGNFSEAFFGKMHPFSPVNGRFYCENALDSVGKFISKQFEREVSKVNTRVQKYTHGYESRTGKHKNGSKGGRR